ncbi:MAG: DUF192 domain-containing protein [Candidatus Colwellbacteria bacterium]|nr:DUF192 domain-containing protein [Candidatus Colwellbacteria bacterium]
MLKKIGAVAISAFFIGLIFLLVKFGAGSSHENQSSVVIKGEKFSVELADSPIKKMIGLAGRKSLDKNEGMLFPFENPTAPAFWMKGMLITIDIIWIRDGKVIGFEENLKPEGNKIDADLKMYRPSGPVDSVLEVAAGTVSELGIATGDVVTINLSK